MTPDRYRQRFAQQLRDGLYVAAAKTLGEWQARLPAAFEPRFHQIQLHLLNGACRSARDTAAELMVRTDCPPRLALEAALCLKSFALHDLLISWAGRYTQREHMPARDIAHVATTLSGVGAHALALEWADLAVAKSPGDAVCEVNRALILSYLGEFDRSRVGLERVIATSKHQAMAYWLLARLRRQTPETQHVAAMRQLLAETGMAVEDRAFLGYALFKELDDLGDHAQAWAALHAANQAARISSPYHATAQEHVFSAIKGLRLPEPAAAGGQGEADQVPIFIVGLHRSGTSLIERILGASPDVHDLGETDRLSAALRYGADIYCERVPDLSLLSRASRIDYKQVSRVFDQAALAQSGGKRFVTEKSPGNFLNIGFIRQAMPHARILHMRRDPIDLCFANYREHFAAQVTHTHTLEDLVHYHGLYRDLMRHWHDRFPGFILDVDYEQLVRDPEAESRRVYAFIGLDWRADAVAIERRSTQPVATLSSVQVRQPVNTASIGRWRPYAPWLGTLIDAFPDAASQP
jgi:hypothetical protein